MPALGRNEYLDSDGSDAEDPNRQFDFGDVGYDSEEAEQGRSAAVAATGRASKRRKVGTGSARLLDRGSESEREGELDAEVEDEERGRVESARTKAAQRRNAANDRSELDEAEDDDDDDDEINAPATTSDRPTSKKRLSADQRARKEAAAAALAQRKSGVVYISRVPPFMKPDTLRRLLQPHARKGLGRIFLTPEDPAAHTARVRSGGNRKKTYTDGWIEFTSKTEARAAVDLLNGHIMGGKKGNFYHDDLWNLRYLKGGFKWAHLTEQIANENAERAARLREEIRRSRSENAAFVRDVEQGKMLEGMEKKRKARGEDAPEKGTKAEPPRMFKQQKAHVKDAGGTTAAPKPSAQSSRVLSKVF